MCARMMCCCIDAELFWFLVYFFPHPSAKHTHQENGWNLKNNLTVSMKYDIKLCTLSFLIESMLLYLYGNEWCVWRVRETYKNVMCHTFTVFVVKQFRTEFKRFFPYSFARVGIFTFPVRTWWCEFGYRCFSCVWIVNALLFHFKAIFIVFLLLFSVDSFSITIKLFSNGNKTINLFQNIQIEFRI